MGTVRQRGFTLIELVACIVILAVLAAIAAPRFFDNRTFSERGYAAEIASALRTARQVAVTSECDVWVTIDPIAGYQAMQRVLVGGICSGAWAVPVRSADGAPLAGPPASGAALPPATQIVFGARGQVVGAAPPPLVIGAFNVTVDPLSGFVSK